MRRTLITGMTATLLLAGFVPGAAAQAPSEKYADLEFIPVLTDAQDHAGFLDMREIAFAEPGDDTLLARFTVQDASISDGAFSIHLFMSVPSGSFRAGVGGDGSPATHSSSSAGFSTCEKEANRFYCVMPYADMDAEVGDALTGTSAISYAGVAQDYMPGGYFESSLLGNKGDDYVLTGSTALNPPATAQVIEGDLGQGNETHLSLEINATSSDSYVYSWNSTATNLLATYNVSVSSGEASLRVYDGANATILYVNESASAENEALGNATAGDWRIEILLKEATGNFALSLAEQPAAPAEEPPATEEPEPEPSDDNATAEPQSDEGDDAAAIPGPGLALAVIGAAAAFALARRRD